MFKIRIGKPKRRHWYGVTFRREMQARLENGNIPWFMKNIPKKVTTKKSPERSSIPGKSRF
jgi:hypothetical protein